MATNLLAGAAIVAVDTGGTFTDIVFVRDGAVHVLKLPSTPSDPAHAVVEGVAHAFAGTEMPIRSLTHGSTVATNALLERKGARVALITNAGCEDIIEIGRQNRPQLYALSGVRPAPLVTREMRFGIRGRLDYTGREIEPVDAEEIVALRTALESADAIAVCLLHCYANPAHEQAVADSLKTLKHVSISSTLLPEYREFERTATTVVNAYVAPLMDSYLARLETDTAAAHVRIMGSGGGAVTVAHARREPVHTVLSGPAGGVAGALASARAAGIHNIISFDMGGTSTDVSLCAGGPLYTREFTIAGMPVAIPMLDIHTVGAGGGSIAWIDAGGALRVGPRSAGAQPGPICYQRGGVELTVTDANVWLGRLPDNAVLGGAQLLDRAGIAAPLAALAKRVDMTPDEAAEGIITIANSTMEGALRVISVERGFDPIDFTLVAFGGAAGLHAVDLAERLGIPRVLVPLEPGVLSAYGMLASPVRKTTSRTVMLRANESGTPEEIKRLLIGLEAVVDKELAEDGAAGHATRTHWIDARYEGQSYELRVPAESWIESFHEAHRKRYGYDRREAAVEAVTLRVEAMTAEPELPPFGNNPLSEGSSAERLNDVYFDNKWQKARVLPRSALANTSPGPMVITEYSATTWVPAGWIAERLPTGALVLSKNDIP